MTKKIVLIISLILCGCGSSPLTGKDSIATPKTHNFLYQNQNWSLQVPNTWEILPSQTGVLFMARNGDENIAILERDLHTSNPIQKIIDSAQKQFFKFELTNQSATTWQFVGQPGPTNTPRVFWQKIKTIPSARKFLLASCSQHQGSPTKSSCKSILKSWKVKEK